MVTLNEYPDCDYILTCIECFENVSENADGYKACLCSTEYEDCGHTVFPRNWVWREVRLEEPTIEIPF